MESLLEKSLERLNSVTADKDFLTIYNGIIKSNEPFTDYHFPPDKQSLFEYYDERQKLNLMERQIWFDNFS